MGTAGEEQVEHAGNLQIAAKREQRVAMNKLRR